MSMKQQGGKSNSLGMLIFVAILVHKIPASIGLGSFLLACPGVNHLRHLLAFTLASPIVCILTFLALIMYQKNNAVLG